MLIPFLFLSLKRALSHARVAVMGACVSNCVEDAHVRGATEDTPNWRPPIRRGKVVAVYDGDTITVDFSPKGGPFGLTGKYDVRGDKGILWPDKNKWPKVEKQ